jgi:HEAT repeat protein
MRFLGVRAWVWGVCGIAALISVGVVLKHRRATRRVFATPPAFLVRAPSFSSQIRVAPKGGKKAGVTSSTRETSSSGHVAELSAETEAALLASGLPTVRELQLALLDRSASPSLQTLLARLKEAGNEALPILGQALKSDSRDLRLRAATTLSDIGTSEAARLLIGAIGEETESAVRQRFESVLAAWSDPRGAEALVDGLQNCDDPRLRDALASALAPMLNAENTGALLQQFNRPDADANFRRGVAATLARARSEAVGLALATYLDSVADDTAIRYLGETAAEIGDHAVVAALLNAYRRVGNDENFDYFLNALGNVTNPAAVSAFAEALGRPDDQTDTWRIAAVGLSGMGTPEAVDVLVKEARNAQEDSERRKALVGELSRIRNPDSLDRLVNDYVAVQTDAAIARALAQAILNIGEEAILKQYGETRGQEYINKLKQSLEPEK